MINLEKIILAPWRRFRITKDNDSSFRLSLKDNAIVASVHYYYLGLWRYSIDGIICYDISFETDAEAMLKCDLIITDQYKLYTLLDERLAAML